MQIIKCLLLSMACGCFMFFCRRGKSISWPYFDGNLFLIYFAFLFAFLFSIFIGSKLPNSKIKSDFETYFFAIIFHNGVFFSILFLQKFIN